MRRRSTKAAIAAVGLAVLLLIAGSVWYLSSRQPVAVTVKGAEPVTLAEVNDWTNKYLAFNKYQVAVEGSGLPLDPPRYRRCLAHQSSPPTSSPEQRLQLCRDQFQLLRTKVVNTLILYRWQLATPARRAQLPKDLNSFARNHAGVQARAALPAPGDQQQFEKITGLSFDDLINSVRIGFPAFYAWSRSETKLPDKPTEQEIDSWLAKNRTSLRYLPPAAARQRALAALADQGRQNFRGPAANIAAIRRDARCYEGVTSPFCGNRPLLNYNSNPRWYVMNNLLPTPSRATTNPGPVQSPLSP